MGDDAYHQYIICKSYHSSSRQNIYHRLYALIDDILGCQQSSCVFLKNILEHSRKF
jgi:hypothetical protein